MNELDGKKKDRALKARLRQDRKSYHVTAVLSAEESRKYMAPQLPKEVSVQGKDGHAVTLTLDYLPEPRKKIDEGRR